MLQVEQIAHDLQRVDNVVSASKSQADSVRGKDTPYRVEFRYRGGTRHYQYFVDVESAEKAEDWSVRYGLTGRAVIETPLSQQVQVRGPRGGWKSRRKS